MSLVQNTLVKVERHVLGKKHYRPAEGAHDMLSSSKTQNFTAFCFSACSKGLRFYSHWKQSYI